MILVIRYFLEVKCKILARRIKRTLKQLNKNKKLLIGYFEMSHMEIELKNNKFKTLKIT